MCLTNIRYALSPGLLLVPRTVTFTTQNDAPLPDPRYLALHSHVPTWVVHRSGAEQYIDNIDNDESSSRALVEALTRIPIAV